MSNPALLLIVNIAFDRLLVAVGYAPESTTHNPHAFVCDLRDPRMRATLARYLDEASQSVEIFDTHVAAGSPPEVTPPPSMQPDVPAQPEVCGVPLDAIYSCILPKGHEEHGQPDHAS